MNTRVQAVLTFLLLGCASASAPSKPIVEFPSQSALQKITARPAAPVTVKTADLPEITWTIAGKDAASSVFEAWAPSNDGEKAMAELLVKAGRAPRVTKGMSCVARELARFFAQSEAPRPMPCTRSSWGPAGRWRATWGWCPMKAPCRRTSPTAR